MNVLRLIQRGRLCPDFPLQIRGILDGVPEIDAAVFVLVDPDGENVEMRLFRFNPGAERGGFHIALDGVAAVEGGNADFILAGNGVDLPAVFKDIAFRFSGNRRYVGSGLDVDAAHVRVNGSAVQRHKPGRFGPDFGDFPVIAVGLNELAVVEQAHFADAAARACGLVADPDLRRIRLLRQGRKFNRRRRAFQRIIDRERDQARDVLAFELCRHDVRAVKNIIELVDAIDLAAHFDMEILMAVEG